MTKSGWIFLGVLAVLILGAALMSLPGGDGDVVPAQPAGEVHENMDSTGAN